MRSETAEAVAVLDAAIRSRRSVRAFRPDPVPRPTLIEIVETARAAPSNFNSQPWRVHILTGEPKRALGEAMLQAHVEKLSRCFRRSRSRRRWIAPRGSTTLAGATTRRSASTAPTRQPARGRAAAAWCSSTHRSG